MNDRSFCQDPGGLIAGTAIPVSFNPPNIPNDPSDFLAWRLPPPCGMGDRTGIRELEDRTRRFAISVVHIVRVARRQPELRSACEQLNDAAGSVASNHRAAGRARSTKEFAAKLQIVHEEADESAHWLLQLKETNREATLTAPLERALQEAIELRNIFGKGRATTRNRYFPERKPERKPESNPTEDSGPADR